LAPVDFLIDNAGVISVSPLDDRRIGDGRNDVNINGRFQAFLSTPPLLHFSARVMAGGVKLVET
jgi:hypothetical protein